MKNIEYLKQRHLLTEQQYLHAYQFSKCPNAYNLAPTFHRVLHDAITMEEPLQAMEQRRGWPVRSAKAIIGLILHAMQEVHGSHRDVTELQTVAHLREVIDHLTGDDIRGLQEVMAAFDLTRREAQIFLILRRTKGKVCSRETILNRLSYSGGDTISERTVDTHMHHLRVKLAGSKWRVDTVWGEGFRLVEVVRFIRDAG